MSTPLPESSIFYTGPSTSRILHLGSTLMKVLHPRKWGSDPDSQDITRSENLHSLPNEGKASSECHRHKQVCNGCPSGHDTLTQTCVSSSTHRRLHTINKHARGLNCIPFVVTKSTLNRFVDHSYSPTKHYVHWLAPVEDNILPRIKKK